MGIWHSNSGLDLHRDHVCQNLIAGGLVNIIGYKNEDDVLPAVTEALAKNYRFSGDLANKDNISVVCAAAVSGQGKTELCRQLAYRSEDLALALNLPMLIPVPISFHQCTPFLCDELSKRPEQAIIWRSLYAFGIDRATIDSNETPCSLFDLTHSIRKFNSSNNRLPMKLIGVLFLVDEILKVRSCSESFYRDVLDLLCNWQQRELREGYPTFLFVTSLELIPLSAEVVARFGRKISLVPIPFLQDVNIDIVSTKLYNEISTVLGFNVDGEPSRRGEKYCFHLQLKNLIRLVVSTSGGHFRCLEDAMRSLYHRLVSVEQHKRAKENSNLNLPKLCGSPRRLDHQRQAQRSQRSEEDIDLAVKDVFDNVVAQAALSNVGRHQYLRAMDLFLALIDDPDLVVVESQFYDLEAVKIVFVKSRNLETCGEIVPRVNLPFMFFCPCHEYSPAIAPLLTQKSNLAYLQLHEPAVLKRHAEILLQNIGTALALPFHQLPTVLEDIIVFVELLTITARCCAPTVNNVDITLENLIPGVLFKPWSSETLTVSPFIVNSPFRVSHHVPTSDSTAILTSATMGPMTRIIYEAIRLAKDSTCDAAYISHGQVNATKIEHISKLFAVRQEPLLCLCSMALHQPSDIVALARDLHQFVAEEVNGPSVELPDRSYYAVIYTCAREDSICMEDIPPGTIIVGLQSILKLLHPFGMSILAQVVEEKARA